MLDLNLIRENPQKVKEALAKKLWDADFTEFLKWDEERKEKLKIVEAGKAEQNKLSASVPQAKKNGEDVTLIFAKVKQIAAEIKETEAELDAIEKKMHDFVAELPNIPDDDLLGGGKENNKVISTFGEKPHFDFEPKDHVYLAESLGLVDYTRGAKIAGRGSWVYTNLGARLEWALLNFFISEHLNDGYEMVLPPHLLNEESGYVAGQFPKFKEFIFYYKHKFEKFLIGRSLLKEFEMVYDYANKQIGFYHKSVRYIGNEKIGPPKVYHFLKDDDEYKTKRINKSETLLPDALPDEVNNNYKPVAQRSKVYLADIFKKVFEILIIIVGIILVLFLVIYGLRIRRRNMIKRSNLHLKKQKLMEMK